MSSSFPRGGERARLPTLSWSETGTGADLSTSWAGEEGGGWVLFTPSHTPQRKMERSPCVRAPCVSVLPTCLGLWLSLPRSGSLPWGNTVSRLKTLLLNPIYFPFHFSSPFLVFSPNFHNHHLYGLRFPLNDPHMADSIRIRSFHHRSTVFGLVVIPSWKSSLGSRSW